MSDEQLLDEIDRLSAENERLRDGLDEVIELMKDHLDIRWSMESVIDEFEEKIQEIASKAEALKR